LKWSSQTGPARRTAPAFVWAGRGLPLRCAAPAASPRKRSSGRPRDSGRRVLRPVREELSLDWDWAKPQPRATPASPRPRKPGPWTEIAAAVRREARGLRHWPRTPDGVNISPARSRGGASRRPAPLVFRARWVYPIRASKESERPLIQNPGAPRAAGRRTYVEIGADTAEKITATGRACPTALPEFRRRRHN
jgi:hypothetical protein